MKKVIYLLALVLISNTGFSQSIISLGDDERPKIGNTADRLNKFMAVYKSAKDLYEASSKLGKGDCSPDFSIPANSMAPTFCGEDTACTNCYVQAYGDLAKLRIRLAKLKCMGANMNNYVTACNSFGDNVAGIHALTGLAWQSQKVKIGESFDKFKNAYDEKYKELIEDLNITLMDIDECEAANDNPDWFQRYGFMYFEFMVQSYKRNFN